MRHLRRLILAGFIFILAGCTSAPVPPPVDPAETAKFGVLPPDYKSRITAWLGHRENILSADQVTFDAPRHGVVQAPQGPQGLQNFYGWMIRVTIKSLTDPKALPRHAVFMFGADGNFGDVTDALVRGFGSYVDPQGRPIP